MSNLILKSAVIEVRFPLVLQFKDKAMPYFQSHVAEFNRIQLDEDKNINLIDDVNTCRFFCEKQRAGIVAENDAELVSFNRLTVLLEGLVKHLGLASLQFVGVRTWFLTTSPQVTYEILRDRYARKLLNVDLIKKSLPQFSDFAVVYESTAPESMLRVTTGIVNKSEVKERHSEFSYDDDPDVAVLHDIDNVALRVVREKFASRVKIQISENYKLAESMKEQLDDILQS